MSDEKKPEETEAAEATEPESEKPADEKAEEAKTADEPKKADPPKASDDEIVKAPWGEPLAKLDRAWTKLEARLAAGVLVAEIAVLVFWISIRALSSSGSAGSGQLYRQLLCAALVGGVTWRFVRKHPQAQIIGTGAVIGGAVLGSFWGEAGTVYFSNLFAWLQNSSILVFFGGASDLAKRFTLWLALLGASLATAQGKHINVDVVMRFLTPKMRVPVAVVGWVAAAIVAISASWGFFDFVAVEEMKAPTTMPCPGDAAKRCTTTMGSKVDAVTSRFGRDVFLTGRQISLDLKSFPKVISGTPYNKYLTPKEWNEWLRDGGWSPRFKPEEVKLLELPEDGSIDFRNPSVTAIPGSVDQVAKMLVPMFDLIFAFGLFVVGIRFLVRSLLAISGHIKVDPNAAHGDDDLAHAHDSSAQAAAVDAAAQGSHT
ncbi:MAG: TRAP transporter small permease subunit [Labilithrix sp.]